MSCVLTQVSYMQYRMCVLLNSEHRRLRPAAYHNSICFVYGNGGHDPCALDLYTAAVYHFAGRHDVLKDQSCARAAVQRDGVYLALHLPVTIRVSATNCYTTAAEPHHQSTAAVLAQPARFSFVYCFAPNIEPQSVCQQ